MKNQNHINEEVNKTLESFDGIKRAEANPYLYSTIKNKLMEYPTVPKQLVWLSVGVAASLALAVYFNSGSQNEQSATEKFAQEYNISVDSYTF